MEESKLVVNDKSIISRGGTAMVYHGFWGKIPVAVKKMADDKYSGQIKNSERFQIEKNVLIQLGATQEKGFHSSIIRLFGWTENPPCLALEYGERELRARLFFDQRKLGPVSVELRMQYAVQIVSGLVFMHGRRIAHLDLNSENVVLVNNGTQAKIVDFGRSVLFSADQENYEDRFTFGTPGYVAPEADNGIYGFKSDVWAFGVILWGLVTYKDARKEQRDGQWDFSPPAEFPECTETQVTFMQSFWRHDSKERPVMNQKLITEMKGQFNIPETKEHISETNEPAQESSARGSEPSKGCSVC